MPGRYATLRRATSSEAARRPGDEAEAEAECPFHFPSLADRGADAGPRAAAAAGHASFHDLTKQTLVLTEPRKDRGGLKERRRKWKFGFDRVFHQDHGQEDVWAAAAPLVQSAVDGFHVCMFGESRGVRRARRPRHR